jgi:hypothetical protein
MSDRLKDVLIELDRLKVDSVKAGVALAKVLPAASGPHDISSHLLAYAEEFGIAQALKKVVAEPKYFDLPKAPDGLAPLLTRYYELSIRRDELVAEREAILSAHDPNRVRVYAHQDREFYVDTKQRCVVYTDNQERHVLPFDKEPAPPAPAKKKAPKRDRERER